MDWTRLCLPIETLQQLLFGEKEGAARDWIWPVRLVGVFYPRGWWCLATGKLPTGSCGFGVGQAQDDVRR